MIANPNRLLELINENQEINGLVDLLNVRFLVVDEYIQFRKTQTMDLVKNVVDMLRVAHSYILCILIHSILLY